MLVALPGKCMAGQLVRDDQRECYADINNFDSPGSRFSKRCFMAQF